MSGQHATLNIWAKIALLFSPVMTSYVLSAMIPILPLIEKQFADTPGAPTLTRLLVTSIGISMVFGAPIAGYVADRLGWRRVLLTAITVFAVAGVAPVFMDNLWAIVASRFILGLAAATTGTLLMAVAATMEEQERNRWLGYIVLAGSVAALIAMPTAGFLGRIEWRAPFLPHAAVLLLGVLVVAGIPDRKIARPSPDERVAAKASSAEGLPYTLMGVALITGILVAAQGLYTPFHLASIGLADPATISLVMLPAAATGAIMSFLFGRIRRSLSMPMTFVVAFLFSAAGHALVGASVNLQMAIAGATVVGVAIGLMTPNLYAFAAQISTDTTRARNIGFARGLYTAGPFVAQIALEPIASATAPSGAILALGLLAVLAAFAIGPAIKARPTAAA